MFERLVESDSAAQFKPRRSYFMVSTVVVGILFLTAVVISLYAEDLDLGTSEFELVEMLAPVAADAPEPPEIRANPAPAASQELSSRLPVRSHVIARIEDNPSVVPETISSTPSKFMTRPPGDFIFNPSGVETNGSGPPNRAGISGTCTANCGSSSDTGASEAARSGPISEPPPPARKDPPVKPPVKSGGVLNGKAEYLPKPIYPSPAQAVGAQGNVNVQVLIDEKGKVVSAKAVDGHPLLRATAVDAAKRAKFSPTLLSDAPVKVTGIIIYKFSRN